MLLKKINNSFFTKFKFLIIIFFILNLLNLSNSFSKEVKIIANQNNIEQLLLLDPNNVDFLFIYAKKQEELGDYETSEKIFKKIISLSPKELRYYLDLAKIQFLKLDYENSEKNFRYVYESKNIPSNVKYNIRNYLKILDKNKSKKINYNIKISHNDNINNGTYADTVELFGVPFKIDENAKAKKSYEVLTNINGRNNFYYKDRKFLSSFDISHSDFEQSNYDRLRLGLSVGPEFKFGKKNISSLLYGHSKELLGGENSLISNTISFNTINYVKPDLSVSNELSVGDTRYYNYYDYNSDIYSFSTDIKKLFNNYSTNFKIQYIDTNSNKDIYGNIKKKLQLDFSTILANSLILDLSTGKEFINYDQYQPIFLKTRKDELKFFSLDLWSDRIYFGDFYPKLSFLNRKNKSNINVYKTSSNNISLFFVKDF